MKIRQEKTPEEFSAIDKLELYKLWFKKALTDKQVATLYGVTKQDVKNKRKEFGYTLFRCAILSIIGGDKYK